MPWADCACNTILSSDNKEITLLTLFLAFSSKYLWFASALQNWSNTQYQNPDIIMILSLI